MKFRFTLTHRGSEIEPIGIPPLSQWSTQTGSDEEWSEGTVPSVTLPGTGPFSPAASEYLYVDFGFEDGSEYSVTLQHTTEYNSGSSNPRTVTLAILDNSFAVQFSETDTFPPSPGGTDAISISFTANSTSTKIGFKGSSGSNVTIVVNEVSGTGTDPSDITESLQISEPDGWKEAVMKLARDKDFHSLVELFDGSFIFYGDNGVVNGGIHFIEFYEISKGLDANIEILIEIAPDDETYETCFEGQLDLSLGERLPKNKYRIPIIRDNFWAKFISRYKTPVDLQAAVDLDGAPIVPVEPVQLTLTDQKVTYFSDYNWVYTMTYPDDTAEPDKTYLMLSFEEEIRSDIKLFSLARQGTDAEGAEIFGLFEAPWNGEYLVQIRIICADYDAGPNEWDGSTNTRLRIRKTNESSFTVYQLTGGVSNGTDFAIIIDVEETFTLARGEQLSIMLHRPTSSRKVTVFGKQQLTWVEVDLATTTTTDLTGEETIDGVLTSASRVLVKNQGNPQDNGIYVTGAGAWSRATDMDTADEFNDVAVYVSAGTDQTDTAWRQTETLNTVGVDAVRFVFTEPSDEWQKPFDEVYDADNYVLSTGPDPQPDSEVFTERTTPGSFIKITATTVYPATESPGFLVHDAAAAILKAYGLEEDNPFYSELLGSALTNARIYGVDGCAWRYLLLRGLQIRGYTLADKPMSMSFEQWWKGIDPILCLGLSYEDREGEVIITIPPEVQGMDDWFDAGTPTFLKSSIQLEFVNWDSGDPNGTTINFTADGNAKNETAVTLRGSPGEFTVSGDNNDAAANYEFAWETDYAAFLATTSVAVNVVTIQAIDYGVVFAAFAETPVGRINETIVNGPEVADWDYVSFTYPSVTVPGDGGLTEYTCGAWMVEAGRIYTINVEVDVDGSPSANVLDLQVIWAVLDASFNPIVTETFNYNDSNYGVNSEQFTFTIPSDGEYLAVRLINNTTADAKTVGITLAEGVETTEVIAAGRFIRVEEREFFYQDEMSVLISNIEDISRKYDTDKIYNKIEIGYNQWQSEDISGIDDPQTKHVYSDRFQKVGQEIIVLSDFIAASLAIETTRRQSIEKSTDYKFDNNTFIVAINTDDVSPDSYRPELGSAFSSILNLLNSESRYNIRISVAHNFLRWRKWFNGCLQSYLSSFFKFVSGEGNYDMVATIDESTDCLGEDNEGQALSEKQDIEVTDTIVHTPFYYEFDVPMEWETYKTIRENRRNAIGISLTDSGHVPLFIDQLDYEVMNGTARVTGWTKVYFPLEVIEGPAPTQECFPSAEACENAITNELGEVLTDENGICITFEEEEEGEGIFDYTFDNTFE